MVVVALLSVDLVESVDLVSVVLVVNCITYMDITYVGHSDFLFESKAKDQIVQNISLLLEVVGLRKLFDQLFQT